jgi:hypothetical protein
MLSVYPPHFLLLDLCDYLAFCPTPFFVLPVSYDKGYELHGSQSRETKICIRVPPRDSESRMTVLASSTTSLPDRPLCCSCVCVPPLILSFSLGSVPYQRKKDGFSSCHYQVIRETINRSL